MYKNRHHGNETLSAAMAVVSSLFPLLCLLVSGLFQSTAHAAWQPVQYSTQAIANSGDYGRWWQTWNDATGSALASINDIYVDNENRILSAGYIDAGAGGSIDLYVARHDSNGTLMWEDVFDGGLIDKAVFITQDPAGNVMVVGTTVNSTSKETDVIVLKYALDGTRIWSLTDPISGSLSDVRATMGAAGEIYVAATHDIDGVFNKDIVLFKFDTSPIASTVGTVVQMGSNYAASTAGGAATVADIAVAPDGTVVIAGTSDEMTKDIVVLKYNPDGSVPAAWAGGVLSSVRFPDWSANDYASALYINNAGEIFVAGWTFHDCSGGFGQGKHNLIVLKLAADASLPAGWTDPACHISDLGFVTPKDIITDSSNNIYVAGQVGVDVDADTLLVSFDGQGNKRWVRRLDVGYSDSLEELVQSPTGDLFAVGTGNHDALLVQYATDGTLKNSFVEDYSGADDNAAAVAMAQDGYGNPSVLIGGGSAQNAQNTGKLLIRAYSQLRADLQALSVSAPAIGGFQSTITITNAVSNIQNAALQSLSDSGSFIIGLYLWPDDLLPAEPVPGDPNLIYLGQRTVNGLLPGQQDSVGTPITVPTITAKLYHVVIIADINNSVGEYDKANNLFRDPNTIDIFDPPDLQPLAVTGPATASAAATIPVNYVVTNNRSANATSSFDVSFFLSFDSIIGNADDVQLQGTGSVAGLAGNTTLDTQLDGGTVNVTIPNNITPGFYFLGVNIDVNNTVVEAFEDNNVYLGTAAIIDVKAIPDLSVQSVSGVQLGAVLGGPLDVDTTVYNAATAGDTTQTFTVSAYLSADNLITTSDYFLGSRTVNIDTLTGISLGAGQTDSGAGPIAGTVPTATSGLTAGSYYIGAIVDSANTVAENDETNNSAVSSQMVTIGDGTIPDLMVTDVTLTTAPPIVRGNTITVSTTVENVLPVAIPSTTQFRVGIYLSTDPVITTSDKLIGQRPISTGIGGPGVDTGPVDITLPSETVTVPQWTNIVKATVDANNTLTSTATGAGASSTQQLTGDLAVESTAQERTTTRLFGLSLADNTQTNSDYSYAFWLNFDRKLWILEKDLSGTTSFFDPVVNYNTGDVLRIERTNGVVTFRQNGVVLYQSPYTSTAPMVLDTNLVTVGATIYNAKLIQVDLAAGSYYLGAIVDDTAVVAEVDELNNTQVQTDASGVASSTVVSVLSGEGKPAKGGGAVGMFSLCLLLLSIAVVRRRLRRIRIVGA